MKTLFWDLFVSGGAKRSDVYDFIGAWNASGATKNFYKFLGCSEEQFALMIRWTEHEDKLRPNSDAAYGRDLLLSLLVGKE